MRIIYSLLMYLLTPLLLIRLWWKGRQFPAYRQRLGERFGLSTLKHQPVDVWLHAVSLGEVIAATPLIEALLEKQFTLLITTMTPTGSAQVQSRFKNRVLHQYLPYDLPVVLRRFFRRFKPRVGVIVETELWPNLIHEANRFAVPLLLVNARLGEKSFQSYLKFKFFFAPLLNQFHALLVQSEADAKRFIALGAKPQKVQCLGNIKFDLQINTMDTSKFKALKTQWGADRPVVIVASTHESEEAMILAAWPKLLAKMPEAILLLVPRHPERFQSVYQLSLQAGFKTGLRSQMQTITRECDVVVVDSLGELMGMYQLSDYAFVGGSFVPVGGHNVLEPIGVQVPVFSGLHVHHFQTICEELMAAQAIQLVPDAEALMDAIVVLQVDQELKSQQIVNATAVLARNKGSVLEYVGRIEQVLSL